MFFFTPGMNLASLHFLLSWKTKDVSAFIWFLSWIHFHFEFVRVFKTYSGRTGEISQWTRVLAVQAWRHGFKSQEFALKLGKAVPPVTVTLVKKSVLRECWENKRTAGLEDCQPNSGFSKRPYICRIRSRERRQPIFSPAWVGAWLNDHIYTCAHTPAIHTK